MSLKVFQNGLMTGLILQLAVGPVFFFVVNLTLERTMADGLAAVVAVTLVDYLYITLAILGIGKLLEKKKLNKIFGIVSSIVLTVFGLIILIKALTMGIVPAASIVSTNLWTSFTSGFLLTISSPMGIVFWSSIFATKVIENNYSKNELFVFGFSTGLATLLFMGSMVLLLSLIKGGVPIILIQSLNVVVGCVLIGYGLTRLYKLAK